MGFKPYYKWITLNTEEYTIYPDLGVMLGFKPYYKWITLNTKHQAVPYVIQTFVLNLIING